MRVYLFAILFGLYGASLARADQAADPEPVGEKGIIGADRRQLWSQFTLPGVADQAAMRASLAATQRIRCDGSGGSANLVYRADVILFAAHEIFEDDGAPDKNLDHCMFLVKRKPGDGPPERYPLLLSTLDHGAYAPGVGDARKFEAGNQQDWAVARLARPVEGITPLRLNDEPAAAAPGAAVTEVSDMAENWKGPGRETEHLVNPVMSFRSRYISRRRIRTWFTSIATSDPAPPGAPCSPILRRARPATSPRSSAIPAAIARAPASNIATPSRAGSTPNSPSASRARPRSAFRPRTRRWARRRRRGWRARVTPRRNASRPNSPPISPLATTRRATRPPSWSAAPPRSPPRAKPPTPTRYISPPTRPCATPTRRGRNGRRLLIENGENMRLRGRRLDAAFCFQAAFRIAGDGLRPYLQVKIAQTTNDPKVRRDNLRKAYVAGGEALFHLAGAEAELTEIRADGVATAEE